MVMRMPKLTAEQEREDFAWNLKSILMDPESEDVKKLAENQLRLMHLFHFLDQRIERLENE